jgi:tripartite-type tricarboxylate transporter receptor subunit TctC
MNLAIKKALDAPEVRTFMTREALEVIASSPEGLTEKFRNDSARYAKVIQAAGIKAE